MKVPLGFLVLALMLGGCGSDSHHSATPGGEIPAAPTELTALALSGGAHLTWKDNSDDEEHFMVMRLQMGVDQEYQTVTTLPFDTIQHHDAPLTAGSTYKYKVVAMNGAGEADSNEVTVKLP